jgi:hypothetical protein
VLTGDVKSAYECQPEDDSFDHEGRSPEIHSSRQARLRLNSALTSVTSGGALYMPLHSINHAAQARSRELSTNREEI